MEPSCRWSCELENTKEKEKFTAPLTTPAATLALKKSNYTFAAWSSRTVASRDSTRSRRLVMDRSTYLPKTSASRFTNWPSSFCATTILDCVWPPA